MTYVSINGAQHYHEVHGTGEPVLLLHGGFASLESMRPQIDSLAARFEVHAPERPGHGRTADVDGPMSYAQNVADTIAYMDAAGLTDPHIVGFSDGAIIGLLIAMDHPHRIRSLVSISGNLDPAGFVSDEDEEPTAAAEEDPGESVEHRQHRALSPDGPDHVDIVAAKLHTLWTTEPSIDPADLSTIGVPTLVMAGDRDVIRHDHTRSIALSIPGAQLCIVPGAGHGLMSDRPEFVNCVVGDFLAAQSDQRE